MLMKKENIYFLKKERGFWQGKHPTKRAYQMALRGVIKNSSLVKDMMRHADHCNECSLKVIALLKTS